MLTLICHTNKEYRQRHLEGAIRAAVEAHRQSYLLVPEQQTVFTERRMAETLPSHAPLCFEVSNFTRFADTVFRQVGGICHADATRGTRALLLWKTLEDVGPFLHTGSSDTRRGDVDRLLRLMQELDGRRISTGDLRAAVEKLPRDASLRGKLEDIFIVRAQYRAHLAALYQNAVEVLDRLATALQEGSLLFGCDFFLDGFISFTAQQYEIIRQLLRRGDVTVSLCLPADSERYLCFREVEDCLSRLCALARDCGCEVHRTTEGDFSSAGLAWELWLAPDKEERVSADNTAEAPHIRIMEATDTTAMVEAVAVDIAKKVYGGAKYGEFAVIARSHKNYTGLISMVFDDWELPVFLSERTDLSEYEVVRLILSAYAVIGGGWKRGDVISYAKCSLCGLSPALCDELELYTETWRISGRRFTESGDWTMNPDGYTARLSSLGEEILARVNEARRAVITPLLALQKSTVGQISVKEHCRLLYEFLCSLDMERRLGQFSADLAERGESRLAQDYARIWQVLCDCLDRLAQALPDTEVSVREFPDLLRLALTDTDIGRIPATRDEILVGSADLLRVGCAKYVYLLGVNEGVFPAEVTDSSYFSPAERGLLTELGLPLSPEAEIAASRELYLFSSCLSAASRETVLLYSLSDATGKVIRPAEVLETVTARLGIAVEKYADLPIQERLWRADAIRNMPRSVLSPAVRAALAASGAGEEGEPLSLTDSQARISTEAADMLFGRRMMLSHSRLERYASCPFSYLCNYVLRLREDKPAELGALGIGDFIHLLLERFFRELQAEGKDITALTQEELAQRNHRICADIIAEICPDGKPPSARLRHLFSRLTRSASLFLRDLQEEFSHSLFRPVFFELEISAKKENGNGDGNSDSLAVAPITVLLEDGTQVLLNGKIDRVDTYKSGNTVYLRVVDYKTGTKKFSCHDLKMGQNMQLLFYLISLWRTDNPAIRARLQCEEGVDRLLPAGILYLNTSPKEAQVKVCPDDGEAEELAQKNIVRSGFVLDDDAVLFAMEGESTGKYLSEIFTKTGRLSKNAADHMGPITRFEEFSETITENVRYLASNLRTGYFDAAPTETTKGKLPCEYCPYEAICRR